MKRFFSVISRFFSYRPVMVILLLLTGGLLTLASPDYGDAMVWMYGILIPQVIDPIVFGVALVSFGAAIVVLTWNGLTAGVLFWDAHRGRIEQNRLNAITAQRAAFVAEWQEWLETNAKNQSPELLLAGIVTLFDFNPPTYESPLRREIKSIEWLLAWGLKFQRHTPPDMNAARNFVHRAIDIAAEHRMLDVLLVDDTWDLIAPVLRERYPGLKKSNQLNPYGQEVADWLLSGPSQRTADGGNGAKDPNAV